MHRPVWPSMLQCLIAGAPRVPVGLDLFNCKQLVAGIVWASSSIHARDLQDSVVVDFQFKQAPTQSQMIGFKTKASWICI